MKKFAVLTLVVLCLIAFSVPVSAMEIEHQFGGYWRTRAWTQQNFTGEDETEAKDVTAVDTRTRIYYTAKINDNLKLVNKFEFDAAWGQPDIATFSSYGDIGADGVRLEIKNSYADFNMGPMNFKVGVQGGKLGRGFLFDDDFAGAVITYKGQGISIPFIWMKAYEGGVGKDANDKDVDYYAVAPSAKIGEMLTLTPYVLWANSENGRDWTSGITAGADNYNLFNFGLDLDLKLNMGNLWFTGIYQTGERDEIINAATNATDSEDISAYFIATGGNVNLGVASIHGQIFYASGDDDNNDDDIEKFIPVKGQSYYWSEIMGLGLFGDTSYKQLNNNWAGDAAISNILAANIGAEFKPMKKLTLGADVWYAKLAEDTVQAIDGEMVSELGLEVDFKLTYELVDGLNLDVVAAYLFAGDATTLKSPDDANPYELGTRLSLSF